MDQMLQAFIKQLKLREDHFYANNSSKLGKDSRLRDMKGGTASALHAKQDNQNCPFCLGKHSHKNCERI